MVAKATSDPHPTIYLIRIVHLICTLHDFAK